MIKIDMRNSSSNREVERRVMLRSWVDVEFRLKPGVCSYQVRREYLGVSGESGQQIMHISELQRSLEEVTHVLASAVVNIENQGGRYLESITEVVYEVDERDRRNFYRVTFVVAVK